MNKQEEVIRLSNLKGYYVDKNGILFNKKAILKIKKAHRNMGFFILDYIYGYEEFNKIIT